VTPPAPELGQVAPDFTARNQHGQHVRLADTRDRPVALVFFPWAFSGVCTNELRDLQDGLGRLGEVPARVLALSCDPMFALRAFADQQALAFELLSDHWPHGAIARAYGVFDEELGVARRASFVLDPQGVVTWHTLNGLGEARDMSEHLAALGTVAG